MLARNEVFGKTVYDPDNFSYRFVTDEEWKFLAEDVKL
jgi:hypothetical protein